jgi:ubiquinol-cytochrome c reductase cytochrome b subunit
VKKLIQSVQAGLSPVLDHHIPKARLRYVLGSGLFFAIMVQVITGIALAFHYVPSARDAYGSVYTIQNEVTLGWFLRGLHHFGSSMVIVLASLHLIQVFVSGAYRRPRHWNWITGAGLLGVLMGFGLTGYLLPWDQKGYWATQVATNIAGGLPMAGESLQTLVQGGEAYGTATLTRFYALHVFALPIALIALLGPHLMFFMKHGVTAPKKDVEKGEEVTFWPLQAFYDIVFAALILTVLVVLVVSVGAPLDAPADPTGSYDARPEWYFLFLFQLLKYFEGPMVLIGTVVLPGLATVFLILLPWLDRAEGVSLKARWKVSVPMALGIFGVVMLTVVARMEDGANEGFQQRLAEQAEETEFALTHAADGFTPEGTIPALEGRRLFARLACNECHVTEGKGGDKAPALDNFASRAWMLGQIEAPDAAHRFGGTGFEEQMPSADDVDITAEDRKALVELLVWRAGSVDPEALNMELAKSGEEAFENNGCSGCHSLEDEALVGPSLKRYGSAEFIASVIRNPGHELNYGDLNEMPDFKDLSDQQINYLVRYIETLR